MKLIKERAEKNLFSHLLLTSRIFYVTTSSSCVRQYIREPKNVCLNELWSTKKVAWQVNHQVPQNTRNLVMVSSIGKNKQSGSDD